MEFLSEIVLNFNRGSEDFLSTALVDISFGRAVDTFLCRFVREHYEKHFCEFILNLDLWLKRMFCVLICSAEGHFVRRN